jgi:AhpC/TSA family protein
VPSLSGEFDAVVQLGLAGVDLVLAAQHRQVVNPVHVHSMTVRIDDVAIARDPIPAGERTGVRGQVEAQVSTPTVTLPAGGETRVIVHFQVRGRLLPDPGYPAVPDLHGEVAISMDVVSSESGALIDMSLLGRDVQVSVVPAPDNPLPTAERTRIERLIRNYLRTAAADEHELAPAADGRVFYPRVRTLPDAPDPAVALVFNLEDRRPSDEWHSSPLRKIVGAADDFAIGVGGDYLLRQIRSRIGEHPIPDPGGVFGIGFDPLEVALEHGAIAVTLRGHAWFFRRFDFSITQRIRISLTPTSVVPLLDPAPVFGGVAGLPFVRDLVGRAIAGQRDAWQTQARTALAELDAARFASMLRQLHADGVGLAYTGGDISPDGIVVRGSLEAGPWAAPRASFTATLLGGDLVELNALASWVPGGKVDRFTWVDRVGGTRRTDTRSFVARLPASTMSGPASWCLQIDGMQMTGERRPGPVTTAACRVASPLVPAVEILRRLEKLPFALIHPGDPDPAWVDALAHVDPWLDDNLWAASRSNVLVHVAGTPEDVTELAHGLASLPADRPLLAIAVLGSGQLAKVQAKGLAIAVPLALMEDAAGSVVQQGQVSYLVDADGKLAWEGKGKLDAEQLAQALEQTAKGGYVAYEELRLAIAEGEHAPDFPFELADGATTALRKLRGRPVQIIFWTSWSEPSIEQLVRRKDLTGDAVAIAVNDGDDPEQAADALARHGLKLPFVADPDRRVALTYGIRCWPTTVFVDAEGLVAGAQFGLEPTAADFADGSAQAAD